MSKRTNYRPKVLKQQRLKPSSPGKSARGKSALRYKSNRTNSKNANLIFNKDSKLKINNQPRNGGKYRKLSNFQTKTFIVRGTAGQITQQILSRPGANRILNELDMTPADFLNNVGGAIDAIDKGEEYRFPSCDTGQAYCQGSGLCTGPACFKDCSHFGGGFLEDYGMGFNIGGGGNFDWGSYEFNVGVYQGQGAMTWECNIGISW